MSLIRPKQLGLNAQGDLIIGGVGPNFNGTILSLGLANQVPTSNGTTLTYTFIGRLRDGSGNLISDFTAATTPVNNLVFGNANTGSPPTIGVAGTDANIGLNITTVGTGRVNLTGNLFPNATAPAFSVFATQSTAGDLQIVTATPGVDRVLYFDNTANQIEWRSVTGLFGFNQINVSSTSGGGFSGTQPLLSSASTTYTYEVFDGLRVQSNNTSPLRIRTGLGFGSLTQITNPSTDVDPANDRLAFLDADAATLDVHRSITFDQLFSLIPGNDWGFSEYVETGAGGANFTVNNFFNPAHVPTIIDDSIEIYFNGVKLRRTGWTRSGANLTLVDAVNGYSLENGDVLNSVYQW
ncbi:MAG: hypothetical protein NZZ41_00700 [Candidatus Dojkabacteria bacterium]|nr:hypothetical protein [Candidatus Dojkabacteria bacterium]